MPNYATLSPNFRITIPKAIRTAKNWRTGQQLALIPRGKGILLMPVPNLEELAGLARGADPEGCRDR